MTLYIASLNISRLVCWCWYVYFWSSIFDERIIHHFVYQNDEVLEFQSIVVTFLFNIYSLLFISDAYWNNICIVIVKWLLSGYSIVLKRIAYSVDEVQLSFGFIKLHIRARRRFAVRCQTVTTKPKQMHSWIGEHRESTNFGWLD